ncbi:MAG TPA: S-methyl-5-thioribose-1-phosphate isomerase [Roseiflexaceae bacterium]|nr:S-methyl-5-thioribose-1-phosphate isomerase [Roseiflexaceae bacterium]
MSDSFRTVWWERGAVCLIDQRLLPGHEVVVRCEALEDVARAIRTMQVRGAPAIGCTAAYGMALVAQQAAASPERDARDLLERLVQAKRLLDAQRPTAVNLSWATGRVLDVARSLVADTTVPMAEWPTTEEIAGRVLEEAHAILAEDLAMCHAIGRHGAPLIPQTGRVLTHCNAGGLATAGYGTALAPIRTAHEQGRPIHVLVDETRPFLQGARLTAWELQRAGVPLTLITDSMAGYFMRRGEVDCVIVGADRIVANGDVANKIGTYGLAVLARAHGIPFYVAAPSSTVDFALPDGDAIPIEERDPSEVTMLAGQPIAPAGVAAAHPAFDVTPHTLITAIITERGVVEPPFKENLYRLLGGGQGTVVRDQ